MDTRSKHLVPASRRPFVRWPLWIVLLIVVHAFMVGCGGSSQPSGESAPAASSEPAPATETPSAGSTEAPSADDMTKLGAQVYSARCALCHGASGHGDGPASAGLNPKPRNHTDKAYMSTLTDEQLIAVIRNGKGTMPAWGKVLSEAELVAVANHVRSLSK